MIQLLADVFSNATRKSGLMAQVRRWHGKAEGRLATLLSP
jgi:hypothetical protein